MIGFYEVRVRFDPLASGTQVNVTKDNGQYCEAHETVAVLEVAAGAIQAALVEARRRDARIARDHRD